MSVSPYKCPHCGKELSSPDKLAWHLSRECPAWAARVPPKATENGATKPEPEDDQR